MNPLQAKKVDIKVGRSFHSAISEVVLGGLLAS